MRYLFRVLLVFISVSLVLTSPASPPSLNSALFASANSKQGNNSLPRPSTPRCDAAQYGGNVRRQSSLNALAKIPQELLPITMRMRQTGITPYYDILLPLRIISDTGKDFIEVATKDNSLVGDSSYWGDIRSAANSIITTCVSQPRRRGGIVTNVGAEGLLTVTVSSYVNNDITCIPATLTPAERPPPRYEDCRKILFRMPWSEDMIVFSDAPSPSSPAEKLPIYIPSPNEQCYLMIRIEPGRDTASWKDLWAAGVASLEKCVKEDKHSFADRLGSEHKINLLWVKQTPVGSIGTSLLNLTSGAAGNDLTQS